jgi:Rps23 Pro-64 3,4-dihydroxylase Tpa1-like proline 4-hydroxylase
MINFDRLEQNIEQLAINFQSAEPFPLVVIDDFADRTKLEKMMTTFPIPGQKKINKSRDYIFAKNKYEKANFRDISDECSEIYQDLISPRFQKSLCAITKQDVFVDPEFHGGGIHQGGKGSFLDMHVDFNYHPLNKNWFRNLNILLYLNQNWQQEYKGKLKLRNLKTGKSTEIEPLFNRCVIMFTRDYTLHGYDSIAFPEGQYRRSIASYAYSLENNPQEQRSTVWMPDNSSSLKKAIGKYWPTIVKVKTSLFGSGTAKNK